MIAAVIQTTSTVDPDTHKTNASAATATVNLNVEPRSEETFLNRFKLHSYR